MSVFCRALLPGQILPAAQALLGQFDRIVVPEIAFQEFVNAVHLSERRHGLALVDANDLVERFEAIVGLAVWNSRWVRDAHETARRFQQPRIYDAVYLHCALDVGLDLWTCDRRFANSFGHERPAALYTCLKTA